MPFLFILIAFATGFQVADAATVRPITFPVQGEYRFRNDYAEPRAGGAREHRGIDIVADKMTPVVAAADGRITFLASPEASWGYSITIRDNEGYQYRYLHLNNDTPGTDDGAGGEKHAYAEGLRRGSTVTQGQVIGWVGDSGNAENTTSHLHFEIREPNRTYINPYETLVAADTSRSASVPEVQSTVSTAGDIASTQFVFSKYLYRGKSGEEVRQLQIALKALGFFEYPEITGYFGPVTEKAVIAFQKSVSVDPVGMVGPITRGILNNI
jgi:hypothetical protein